MFRYFAIAVLASIMSVPVSIAQMRGNMGHSRMHGGGGLHGAHRYEAGGGIYPLSPFFYSDYEVPEYYPVAARPQVFVMHPPVDNAPEKPRPAPLLIEWKGDRYVRYGGSQDGEQRGTSAHPDYAEPPLAQQVSSGRSQIPQGQGAASTRREPAVLIFRDGHREEISDYAIANGVIYLQGNLWQNSFKSKPIPLTELNELATLEANRQRGVKFLLPSASNVVVASF